MARQAKITISADVKGFKAQVDEAKKALGGLGNVKMSSSVFKDMKKSFSTHLEGLGDDLKKKISGIEAEMKSLASAQDGAFDVGKAAKLGGQLDLLKKKYKEVADLQKNLNKGKMPGPNGEPSEGGGGLGGLLKGGMGMFGKLLGAAGIGLGAHALANKRLQMADERLKMTPLTSDNKTVGESSQLGYSPSERRGTGAEIAQQTQVTGEALTRLTDLAEQLERGYGVSKSDTAGAIGVAKRAGVEDQGKFVASAIGAAVAIKLQGSQIGQYLEAIAGYTSSLSQGVNVDTNSLNGFAAALGTLPFFKNDPGRIFDAIKGIASGFQSGDRFMQAQASRAILKGAPGASAAAVETRRDMGLFGKLDKTTMANFKKAGMDAPSLKALGMTGGQIVGNEFEDIMGSTKGMDLNNQNYAFAQRTQMTAGQSAPIFSKMAADRAAGKTIDFESIAKQIEATIADPQKLVDQRAKALAGSFGNLEGDAKRLSSTFDQFGEKVTEKVTNPVIKAATDLQNSGKAPSLETASDVGAAAVVGGAAVTAAGILASLSGPLEAIVGAGAAATVLTALGVAAAAIAGISIGKVISPMIDEKTDEVNRYGQHSSGTERLIAGAHALTPGSDFSIKDYIQTYLPAWNKSKEGGPPRKNTDADTPVSQFETPKSGMPGDSVVADTPTGSPAAGSNANNVIQFPTSAVTDNTNALSDLTAALRAQKSGSSAYGKPSNATIVPMNSKIGK